MANPRITTRFVEAANGLGGWFVMDDDGGPDRIFVEPERAEIWRHRAAVITILAGLEAYDRTCRERGVEDFDGADVITVEAAALRRLANEIEARRKDLERRHG